jgi:hypothetical protein
VKSPAFTLWTEQTKTRCLEDTVSRGLLYLTGQLDIVGCFFHGPGYGQIRLFVSPHFAGPPYLMGRRSA